MIRSIELLVLIHSNLGDFENTTSRGGKTYYISFLDDFFRFTKICLIKIKDESNSMLLKFMVETKNELDKKIKIR